MKITRELLLDIAPSARPEIVDGMASDAGNALLVKYGIVKAEHLIDFLAQTAEETGGYNRLEENLFYTSVKRLRQVWPARFKSDAAAQPYVRNPEKLANLVYGGRYGNTAPGDGWRYRGSSLIQTTFHDNFVAVFRASGIDCVTNPELIRKMLGALEAALVFWRDHKLNKFAESGDFIGETKVLNGGLTNYAERQRFRERAKRAVAALHAGTLAPAPDTTGWLRKGATGLRVKAWQMTLQNLGYYQGGQLDGVFGDGTEEATRHFQTVKGLVSDGVVGPATQRAADSAKPEGEPPASGPATLPGAPEPQGIAALILALLKAIIGAFTRKG